MDSNQVNPFGDSQPAAPQPQGSQPKAAPTQPTTKKSKRGLILGLAIGGGVLLIALIVGLILLVSGGISRQDYMDAQAKAKEIDTPYKAITGIYLSSYDTEAYVAEDVDTIKTNKAALEGIISDLGEMKAIKKDKTAADYYDKLIEQDKNLEAYVDAELEYLEVISPVVRELSKVSYSDYDSAITALKGYQEKLKNLDLKQQVNKDYLDNINSILPEFISAIQGYVDARNSESYSSSYYSKISQTSTQLTKADSTWKSNLKDLSDKIKFSTAANDLGTYLTSKANGQ